MGSFIATAEWFSICKIFLMVQNYLQEKLVRWASQIFLPLGKRDNSIVDLWNCLQNGQKITNKTTHVWSKLDNLLFIFHLQNLTKKGSRFLLDLIRIHPNPKLIYCDINGVLILIPWYKTGSSSWGLKRVQWNKGCTMSLNKWSNNLSLNRLNLKRSINRHVDT